MGGGTICTNKKKMANVVRAFLLFVASVVGLRWFGFSVSHSLAFIGVALVAWLIFMLSFVATIPLRWIASVFRKPTRQYAAEAAGRPTAAGTVTSSAAARGSEYY